MGDDKFAPINWQQGPINQAPPTGPFFLFSFPNPMDLRSHRLIGQYGRSFGHGRVAIGNAAGSRSLIAKNYNLFKKKKKYLN